MTQTVDSTKPRWQWVALSAAFVIIIILTIYKDLTLTGDQPNLLFYILVPPVSMLGSTLAGYGIIKARKIPIPFWDTLFIVMMSDFFGQVFENVTKLVYYRLGHIRVGYIWPDFSPSFFSYPAIC